MAQNQWSFVWLLITYVYDTYNLFPGEMWAKIVKELRSPQRDQHEKSHPKPFNLVLNQK
jgi:hypothetical protein